MVDIRVGQKVSIFGKYKDTFTFAASKSVSGYSFNIFKNIHIRTLDGCFFVLILTKNNECSRVSTGYFFR